jgi:hypothetical protein
MSKTQLRRLLSGVRTADTDGDGDSALEAELVRALDADAGAEAEFEEVIRELRQGAQRMRWVFSAVFVVALAAVVGAGFLLPYLMAEGVRAVDQAENPVLILIYELFRGTAFVVLLTSVLLGLLSFGRASIDQATRYEKRLVGSHFIHFVLTKYEPSIRSGAISLVQVIEFLAAWNATVETAFTNVKFGLRRSKDIEFVASPQGGITVRETDGARAPRE